MTLIRHCLFCKKVGFERPCEHEQVVSDFRRVWVVASPHFYFLLVGPSPQKWVNENLPENDGPYTIRIASRDDVLCYKLDGLSLRTTDLSEQID